VSAIVFPVPFEKPVTFDEVAVQFIIAVAFETIKFIDVVSLEQIVVVPENVVVVAGKSEIGLLVLLLQPVRVLYDSA
jgi:hypothetical protein